MSTGGPAPVDHGVRVLVFYATEDVAGLETAYHEAGRLLAGTPGLLGNELLRSLHDPDGFVVASSWSSRREFDAWERGNDHKGQTGPLRRFTDTRLSRPFGVYQVTGRY